MGEGEARDIATMAHELGHAVHAMMAEQHNVFTFHSTLPLAETASVFGERILSDALMASETSKPVKQSLLVNQLDDIYATVMRQAYFVAFERTAHDMVAQGATTTDLGKTYLTLLRQQFGKSLRVPQEFQWEWLTIPHIYASERMRSPNTEAVSASGKVEWKVNTLCCSAIIPWTAWPSSWAKVAMSRASPVKFSIT